MARRAHLPAPGRAGSAGQAVSTCKKQMGADEAGTWEPWLNSRLVGNFREAAAGPRSLSARCRASKCLQQPAAGTPAPGQDPCRDALVLLGMMKRGTPSRLPASLWLLQVGSKLARVQDSRAQHCATWHAPEAPQHGPVPAAGGHAHAVHHHLAGHLSNGHLRTGPGWTTVRGGRRPQPGCRAGLSACTQV